MYLRNKKLKPYSIVKNVPVTLLVNDNVSHEVATLVAGASYKFEIRPALSGDGGAASDYIEGWFKTTGAADPITSEGGEPIRSREPVYIQTVTGKEHLYFMKNPDTTPPCKLFLGREDS
jgi:hypothetical protein